MSRPVYVKLKSDAPFLTAIGHLFAAPAPPQMPNTTPVAIRNTVGAEFVLLPGKYEFRFKVKNGEGAFTLKAAKTNNDSDTEQEFDTGKSGFENLSFEFEVTA